MTASGKEITWEEHWASRDTPWDAGESSPTLMKYAATLKPASNARALVPGCGRGWDVFTLARQGFAAIGLDIAPSAALAFKKLREEQGLNAAQADLVVCDFFQIEAADLGGTFDLIWDYTFLCAIDPDQRDQWREQMQRLLAPDGTLALLIYPVAPGAPRDQGPPYPLDPEEITHQLAPSFERTHLERVLQSHPGRENKEWFALFKRTAAAE
jgi:methyl halide transferase